MKVYYAHSISLYGTPQEERDVAALQALGFEVYNPNNAGDDAGYRQAGMAWFEERVRSCGALAFRAHPDGSIPAGVAREIRRGIDLGMPILELPCGLARRELTVEQTREHLKDCGAR